MCNVIGKIMIRFFSNVLSLFPLKDVVVLESNPDYSCNTYPVFLELRKRLPNYKMVWYLSKSTKKLEGTDDVVFYDDDKLPNRIKFAYYKYFSKAFVCCNRAIKKKRNDQLSLYLTHGSITKRTKGYHEPGSKVDFIHVQSHFFDKLIEEQYGASPEKFVYHGFPRCDYFYQDEADDLVSRLEQLGVKGSFIVWLPTFRKQKISGRDAHSKQYESMGIPLIYTEKALTELDAFLAKNKFYIVYKPHPVYEIPTRVVDKLSNMIIIRDDDLKKAGLQLYQLLAKSSALITDYSSVYFDYLLLNKPIATTLDDVECWKNGNGFAFDIEKLYKETNELLYCEEDLYKFVNDVVIGGKDTHKGDRLKMCELTNMHQDGGSTTRTVNFILEKIGML